MGRDTPGGGEATTPPRDIPLTNQSTPWLMTNPTHPKYQNNNINNTQMKMLENFLTES